MAAGLDRFAMREPEDMSVKIPGPVWRSQKARHAPARLVAATNLAGLVRVSHFFEYAPPTFVVSDQGEAAT
jgi:hypothetical protein